MTVEFRAICKDCQTEFGYSESSLISGSLRGMSRTERCPACRRLHMRESRSIGIPQISIKPTCPRKPDKELLPGRLGKIFHEERTHQKVVVEGKFGKPDAGIEFGITDDDIRQLITAMQEHQVTVVVGPTGSGKSTFLPYRLMVPPEGIEPDIFTRFGQIIITQPRKQATRSISEFVARDLHGSSRGAGFDVGFRHSGSPASDWRNKLVYVTDGTLINWIVSGQISELSVIMIDEAHERSLNIDLILGLLKQQLPRFPHLKLIIASATINAALFQEHFGGANHVPILKFQGLKQRQVEAYFPDQSDLRLDAGNKASERMAEKVVDILAAIARGEKDEGDILGFLYGAPPIEDCVRKIREQISTRPEIAGRGIEVLPLYTQLPQEAQDAALQRKTIVTGTKILSLVEAAQTDHIAALMLDQRSALDCARLVELSLNERGLDGWTVTVPDEGSQSFDSFPRHVVVTTHSLFRIMNSSPDYRVVADRRVVISTNVAETSLTVDGVVYVVDSGFINQNHWDGNHGAMELKPIFHSRSGCRQRWGRAGRVRDGEAHMLYSDVQFEKEFEQYTTPEIMRTSLEQLVLRVKKAGVRDINKFHWIERPPEEELARAPKVLESLGALDADGDLTEFGLELESYLEPVPIASLLVAADHFACGVEMATFAAMLTVRLSRGLFRFDSAWDFVTQEAVDELRLSLGKPCVDDMDMCLKLWSLWADNVEQRRDLLCRLFFIDSDKFQNLISIKRQTFLEMLSVGKKADEDRPINFSILDRLRMVIALNSPEDCFYRMTGDGITPLFPRHDGYLPITVSQDSVFISQLPEFFLALNRRTVGPDKRGPRRLEVGCLVRLEEMWIGLRGSSFLDQVSAVAKELRTSDSPLPGVIRHRLLLDSRYPRGTVLRLRKDEHGTPVPARVLEEPSPFKPVLNEERVSYAEVESDQAETDTSATAGDNDKEDHSIAHDPMDDELEPDYTDPPMWSKEEDAEDNDSLANRPGHPEVTDEYPLAHGIIVTDEMVAAAKIGTTLQFQEPWAEDDAFQVIGHNFSDPLRPAVILERRAVASLPVSGYPLVPGSVVDVLVEARLQRPNGALALRVKEVSTGLNFTVDETRLTFHQLRSVVDLFQPGQSLKLAVNRTNNEMVHLTRLPLLEKALHNLIGSSSEKIKVIFQEQINFNDYFLIYDGIQKDAAPLEASMRRQRGKPLPPFKQGLGYSLSLPKKFGYAEVKFPFPPSSLQELLSAEKKRMNVFLSPRGKLHSIRPMSSEILKELLDAVIDENHKVAIRRLYRFSNQLKLNDMFYLEKGQWSGALPLPAPVYSRGTRVKGHVTTIRDKSVFVILELGGEGKIPLEHLSWDSLLDPREVVWADQEIEAVVLKHDSGGILLSLLNEWDQSPYRMFTPGSEHEAIVSKVELNYALVSLDTDVEGFLPARNVRTGSIDDLREFLHANDSIYVTIASRSLNAKDHNGRQASLTVRIKDNISEHHLERSKIERFIQLGMRILHKIEQETTCSIRLDKQRSVARISHTGKTSLKRAISSLDALEFVHRSITIRNNCIGLVIGKERANIRRIMTATNTFIDCRSDGVVKIVALDASRAEEAASMILMSIGVEIKIDSTKIGSLVGKQGFNIKSIRDTTACTLDIKADGSVRIQYPDKESLEKALNMIRQRVVILNGPE